MAGNRNPSELDKLEREWATADRFWDWMYQMNQDDTKAMEKAFDANSSKGGFSLPLRTIEEIIREEQERKSVQAEG